MGTNQTDKFDPTTFSISRRWWDGLWGGGHTLETDPTRRGWRAALSGKGSHCLVIGQRGVSGCASVMELSGSMLDIAYYDNLTPEALAQWLNQPREERDGRVLADVAYEAREAIPGWGLYVLDRIERMRRGDA